MKLGKGFAVAVAIVCALAFAGCAQSGQSNEPSIPDGMSAEAYTAGTEALDYAKEAIGAGTISDQETVDTLGEYMRAIPDNYDDYPQDETVSMAIATIGGGAMNGDEDVASQGVDLLEMTLDGEIE